VNIARTLAAGAKSPLPLWLVYRALRWTPTLVVRGGQSDVLSQATFDRMAEIKPDLMRVVIPHAGHTPTLNEPEARAAIDTLLDKVK
jgi:pimeloyl-ACP methyl ester carboxylesterase